MDNHTACIKTVENLIKSLREAQLMANQWRKLYDETITRNKHLEQLLEQIIKLANEAMSTRAL